MAMLNNQRVYVTCVKPDISVPINVLKDIDEARVKHALNISLRCLDHDGSWLVVRPSSMAEQMDGQTWVAQ